MRPSCPSGDGWGPFAVCTENFLKTMLWRKLRLRRGFCWGFSQGFLLAYPSKTIYRTHEAEHREKPRVRRGVLPAVRGITKGFPQGCSERCLCRAFAEC